jgi:hypothetical protein
VRVHQPPNAGPFNGMIDATSTTKICTYHSSYSVHHQSLKAMKQGLVYMATDDNLASEKATSR